MSRITKVHTAGSPVGSLVHLAVEDYIPNGILICSAQAVSRTTYATLFNKIGTTFGIGDGSTTFNLPPDGLMLRGRDKGSGNDPDATSRTAYVAGTWTNVGTIIVQNTSNIVTIGSPADMANICIGMQITATGLGTTIVTAKLSANTIQTQASGFSNVSNGAGTVTFSKSAIGQYVGSFQADQLKSHTHNYHSPSSSNFVGGSNFDFLNQTAGNGLTTTSTGGNQANPKNANSVLGIVYI